MSTLVDAPTWQKQDEFPESTCYCRCGAVYRSHSKVVNTPSGFVIVSRKPCPECGRDEGNLRRVSSDPEIMTLRK